jgi:hypothetical protein
VDVCIRVFTTSVGTRIMHAAYMVEFRWNVAKNALKCDSLLHREMLPPYESAGQVSGSGRPDISS